MNQLTVVKTVNTAKETMIALSNAARIILPSDLAAPIVLLDRHKQETAIIVNDNEFYQTARLIAISHEWETSDSWESRILGCQVTMKRRRV